MIKVDFYVNQTPIFIINYKASNKQDGKKQWFKAWQVE